MTRLSCLVGVHRWERHVNREVPGRGGGYDLRSRCGRERQGYDEGGNPSFSGPLIA
ncbi:hypothetical protein [Oryzobacter terrae]|uniref:hypothetical protein n=1 Tax=Oryzobacter terrae TaxID=1620385 RepID=UPI003670C682